MNFYMEKQLDGTEFQIYEVPPERRLDKTALGMLGNNRIEGLLPCTPVLVDGKRLLRYPVTDMQPLPTVLSNYLDGSAILHLMDEVCGVLSCLSDYLLDPRMLCPLESAFVSRVDGKLRMTYLPLEPENEALVKPQKMLSQVLNQMMQGPWESAAYTEQMAAELSNEDFSLSRFWKLVQRLQIESQVIPAEDEMHEEEQDAEQETQTPTGRFSRLLALLGIGKQHAAPKEGEKSGRKRKRKRNKTRQGKDDTDMEFAIPGKKEEQRAPGPDVPKGKTIRLDPAVTGKPALIRKRTGECIPIVGKAFSIGSTPGMVDYCISDNSAVASRHAEVRVKDGKCYLVQLAPKASTKVDGVAVAPRVETPLHTGTVIAIADEEFVMQM